MPFSVQRPAVSSAVAPSGISVRAFFQEQLTSSPVAFVPKNYEFGGDPRKKLGEEAEKKVFDMIKRAGRDIPGIQIVCFHGIRVIAGCPIILREVDSCLFISDDIFLKGLDEQSCKTWCKTKLLLDPHSPTSLVIHPLYFSTIPIVS